MGCRKLDISKNYESVLTVVGKSLTTEKLQVEHFWETKKMGVNYYPFGSIMPGRSYNSGDYEYGFNGKRMDNEIKNITGSSYDFGARMYDSRLGRWFSVDPQFRRQPGWSTYKAFLDNPILYVDPDGETEYITIITQNEKTGETTIETMKANRVMTDGEKHMRGGSGAWYYENDYYDYATTTLRTVGVDGKVTETTISTILYDKYKDSDYAPFGGNDPGDTKTEDVWSWVPKFSDFGGLIIYGSAGSSEDTPGTKTTGTPSGSFDFAEFSEIMGLVATSISSKKENTLGTDFSGTKLAEIADKVKEVVEYNKQHKNQYCIDCNRTFDSNGNVIKNDDTPKDTINYDGHK